MGFKLYFLSFFVILKSLLIAEFLPTYNINIIDNNLFTDERYELMKAYTKHHYHMDHANLIDPELIVVHYTALSNLKMSLKAFEPVEAPEFREKLLAHGKVNVGTHYLVNKNGDIYQLYPTTVMVRHVIGFNHTSIAIELVGAGEEELYYKQVKATVDLIHYLTYKHSSIKYLIGHMEYMNRKYDHFKLFLEKDSDYNPHIKLDPGFNTMSRIRAYLKRDHNIVLKK
ncbi:N-acetylmuramoyl-L-alanine amidase [Candidatus Marinamargulisbacteria bacterium SCGC AG-414-C22]|nr:N-acetylmuramoyl-L-alanine amidase [Candidatus Marinamargulisbacteria bacterium SCGC AG-414-C22]